MLGSISRCRPVPLCRPEIVPDLNWVESEIEGIVSSIMRTLVGHPSDIFDEERLRSAVVLCNGVQNTLSILSEHFAVKESLHLFHTLWPLVFSQAQRLTLNATDTQQDNMQTLLSLGLVDTYSVGLTRIMLSFSKSVSSVAILSAKLSTGFDGKKESHFTWKISPAP